MLYIYMTIFSFPSKIGELYAGALSRYPLGLPGGDCWYLCLKIMVQPLIDQRFMRQSQLN